MRHAALAALYLAATLGRAQQPAPDVTAKTPPDPIVAMVGRLNLERYKATVKGLTQFGDRRQGTDRNRAAIDWIEAQLKSYGCTNTERIHYNYEPVARTGAGGAGRRPGGGDPSVGPGGSRKRGNVFPDSVNDDPMK